MSRNHTDFLSKVTQISLLTLFLTAPVKAALISESDIVNNWTNDYSTVFNTVWSGSEVNSANWSQSSGVISGGGNTSGSKLSDFSVSGDFSFSTRVRGNGDNDSFGILFGVQDFNTNYSLTWGGGGVGSLNGIQLRRNTGALNSTVLASQSGNWSSGVVYDLIAGRTGNDIFVSVLNGATTIYSATVTDSTYLTGGIGFDIFSQNTSFSFGSTDLTTSVPGPATLMLLGLGLLGFGIRKQQR